MQVGWVGVSTIQQQTSEGCGRQCRLERRGVDTGVDPTAEPAVADRSQGLPRLLVVTELCSARCEARRSLAQCDVYGVSCKGNLLDVRILYTCLTLLLHTCIFHARMFMRTVSSDILLYMMFCCLTTALYMCIFLCMFLLDAEIHLLIYLGNYHFSRDISMQRHPARCLFIHWYLVLLWFHAAHSYPSIHDRLAPHPQRINAVLCKLVLQQAGVLLYTSAMLIKDTLYEYILLYVGSWYKGVFIGDNLKNKVHAGYSQWQGGCHTVVPRASFAWGCNVSERITDFCENIACAGRAV